MKINYKIVICIFFLNLNNCREDCVTKIYKDKSGVWHPNKNLYLPEDAQCNCNCTGLRTKHGKCIECNHVHANTTKKFAQLFLK